MRSGSSQYLKAYLSVCRDAGFSTSLMFAPRRSFGNVAWARIHPDILSLVDEVEWPQTLRLGGNYISVSPSVWWRFFVRLGIELGRRVSGQKHAPFPSLLGAKLDQRETDQIAERIRDRRPDMVTAEYSSLAPLLENCPEAKKVVFLHDLFSLRAESFSSRGLEPDHVFMSLQEEADRCRTADLVIHASCVEKLRLQEILPQAEHIWMPPVVTMGSATNQQAGDPHAVFIGSVHAGNAVALTFLREKVWPRVRARVPGAMLHVVGSIAETVDPSDADQEGLRLLGVVEDLSTVGGMQAIGLAPMQFGSGIPIKIVDYLAISMPVVVTAGTIDPFGGSLKGLVAEATSDAHFCDLIVMLLKDETARQKMSLATKETANRLDGSALLEALDT
jgi:hypothetical protein